MGVALTILWVCLGALALTAAISLGLRIATAVGHWRLERFRATLRGPLTAYAVEASDAPPPLPRGRFQQRVMRSELLRLVPLVTDASAGRLGALFAEAGLAEAACRDLDSRRPLVRIRAAEALGAMRVREAEAALRAHLGAEDRLLRFACARALGALGAVAALPEIVAALADSEAQLGETTDVLLAFGAPAVPFLCEHVARASVARERWLAVDALGELRTREAIPVLRAAFDGEDDELAARAARALGKSGDVRLAGALVDVLRGDRPWFVRAAAAGALGRLDDPAAAPALAEALDAEEWDLRDAAARALVALGEDGLAAALARLDAMPDAGVAHLAGALDVADRLDDLVARAADAGEDDDAPLHGFLLRASAAGVQARLEETAAAGGARGDYAAAVLAHSGGAPAAVLA